MKNSPADIFKLARTAKGYRARQSILLATADILSERGFDNVTVMAICERADIGRTTLYNYFKDAPEAIDALVTEFALEIQERFERIHGMKPRGTTRLAYCLRFILERAWRDPMWGKLTVNLRSASPLFDDYLLAQVSLEVSAGLESGEMRLDKNEAKVLAPFIVSIIADMCRKLSHKEAQLKDITPVILLVLRAAGVEQARAKEAASQKISRALQSQAVLV